MTDTKEYTGTYGFLYSEDQEARGYFTLDSTLGLTAELTVGGPGSGYFRPLNADEAGVAIAKLIAEFGYDIAFTTVTKDGREATFKLVKHTT